MTPEAKGKIHTTERQIFQARALGLAYLDTATGKEVMIAQLQKSIGVLLPSGNQVLYPDAFTDIVADIQLTYTKAKPRHRFPHAQGRCRSCRACATAWPNSAS